MPESYPVNSSLWPLPAWTTAPVAISLAFLSALNCAPAIAADGLRDDHNMWNTSQTSSWQTLEPSVAFSQVPAAPSAPDASVVSELRSLTGLTASQLARLFGVSRRSVNNWIAGSPMTQRHAARLGYLMRTALKLDATTPDGRRTLLLDTSAGTSLFQQLVNQISKGPVIQAQALSARNQFAA